MRKRCSVPCEFIRNWAKALTPRHSWRFFWNPDRNLRCPTPWSPSWQGNSKGVGRWTGAVGFFSGWLKRRLAGRWCQEFHSTTAELFTTALNLFAFRFRREPFSEGPSNPGRAQDHHFGFRLFLFLIRCGIGKCKIKEGEEAYYGHQQQDADHDAFVSGFGNPQGPSDLRHNRQRRHEVSQDPRGGHAGGAQQWDKLQPRQPD